MNRQRQTSWQERRAFISGVITLTGWRWRQQWFLLLMTWLGITLAIILVCSLPLFFNVMSTAGIRNILRSSTYGNRLTANTNIEGLSSREATSVPPVVFQQLKSQMGTYLNLSSSTEIINTGAWNLPDSPFIGMSLKLFGTDLSQTNAHLQIIQGRLPAATGSELEVILTANTAANLEVTVGSLLRLSSQFSLGPLPIANGPDGITAITSNQKFSSIYTEALSARVVGIFRTTETNSYWNGVDFDSPLINANTRGPYPISAALVSSPMLLHLADQIAQQHNTSALFATSATYADTISLTYELTTSTITNTQLDDLIARLGTLQQKLLQIFHGTDGVISTQPPYILDITLYGQILHFGDTTGSLERFRNQIELTHTPVLILTLEIVCLILFFISIMTGSLIEQQQTAIAVMRSRGASRRQLFGSLSTQSLALCLASSLPGPFLAILLVSFLTPHILSNGLQDAVNAVTGHLDIALNSMFWYALLAFVVSLLTVNLTIFFALRANIITQRREEARSSRRPLWQRLQLDLFLALVALVSYAFTLYFQSTQQFIDLQSQSLLAPLLQLLAPLLLILAFILFFMRFYPLLLRRLAQLTQRRRDLPPMLALVQMERAPRQPMRMALLLGLATAFTFFTLVFSASQAQQVQSIADYQAGADFSGSLSKTMQVESDLKGDTALYRHIPGVLSASLGSFNTVFLPVEDAQGNQYDRTTILSAVDADTFAQTAIWTSQDSSQSLSSLMAQLAEQRPQALQHNLVPAIVESSIWQLLNLHIGATFQLSDNLGNPVAITYKAIAEVNHIPPVDDSDQSALLVDYQTLTGMVVATGNPFLLNYAWLHTSDSSADLTHIRQELNTGSVALASLVDRRALTAFSASDPLLLNLLSILSLGIASALLLAFLANMLLPLLNLRARLTQFAVLRALGTPPALVARILIWEQTFVLCTALLLGLFFGALLSVATIPALFFSGILPVDLINSSDQGLYSTQHTIPIQIVLPPSLALALICLLGICFLTLGLMSRLAQRPLLGQALRLDED